MTSFLLNHVAEVIFLLAGSIAMIWVNGENRLKEFSILFSIEFLFFLIYYSFIYKKYHIVPITLDLMTSFFEFSGFILLVLWSDKIQRKKKKKADYDKNVERLNPSRPAHYVEGLDARGPH